MVGTEKDREQYIEDIKTIKDIMLKTENEPVYENWAFYSWGVILIAVTLIHFFIETAYNYSPGDLFIKVWLPAIILMGLIEVVSIVRNLEKNSLTIFSKRIVRLYLNLFIQSIAYIFISLLIINLGGAGYLPVVILLMAACFYCTLAQGGYKQAYLHAVIFIAIALVLHILKTNHKLMVPLVGGTIGISSVIIGITTDIHKKTAP